MLFDRMVRPALYRLSRGDTELVHERTLGVLSGLATMPPMLRTLQRFHSPDDPTTVFGIRFPGRVGLAAGMDKDGRALRAWPALGFGFAEVGTVTRLPQPGNPQPRLFGLPHSGAVINRMGFNNAGAYTLAQRLASQGQPGVPLGISIGKSKVTPLAEAVDDYRSALRTLHAFADYVAINVSSPNTPHLRRLQDRGELSELLAELQHMLNTLAGTSGSSPLPLLVKVSPDLSEHALGELLEVCEEHDVSGIIATNTTLSREGVQPREAELGQEVGGLSGRPLATRAREVVRFVHRTTGGRLPIIGVGGIDTPDDAERMLDAGASLIQLYSGFALQGPGLVRRINRALSRRSDVAY